MRIVFFLLFLCAVISSCSSNKDGKKSSNASAKSTGTESIANNQNNGSQASNSNTVKTLKGFVIDGPIHGATVFIDSNNNGTHEAYETYVETDENGGYQIPLGESSNFHIVSLGGVNTSTGKEFTGVLSSYIDSANQDKESNITPITTLVSVYKKSFDAKTIEEVTEKVANILNLDKADLDKNPMNHANVFMKSNLINQSVEIITSQLSKDTDQSSNNYQNILSKFAMSIDNADVDSQFSDLTVSVIESMDDDSLTVAKDNIQSYISAMESLSVEDIEKIKGYELLVDKGLSMVTDMIEKGEDISSTVNFMSALDSKAPEITVKVLDYHFFNGSDEESVKLTANDNGFGTFTFKQDVEGLSLSSDGVIHLKSFPDGQSSQDYNAVITLDNGVSQSDNIVLIKAHKLDYRFSIPNANDLTIFVDKNNNRLRDEGDIVLTESDGVYIFNEDMRGEIFHVVVENGISLYSSDLVGDLVVPVNGDDTVAVHPITLMTTLVSYMHDASGEGVVLSASINNLSSRLGVTSDVINLASESNPVLFVKTQQLLHVANLMSQVIAEGDTIDDKKAALNLVMQQFVSVMSNASDNYNELTLTTLVETVLDTINGKDLSGSVVDISANKPSIIAYLQIIESLDTATITDEKYATYKRIMDANLADILPLIKSNESVANKIDELSKRDLVAPVISMPDSLDYYFYTDRDKEFIVLQASDADQNNVSFTLSGENINEDFEAITADNKVRLKAEVTSGRDYELHVVASDGFNHSEPMTIAINVWSWKGADESTLLDSVTIIRKGFIVNKISEEFKDTISTNCSYPIRKENFLFCYKKFGTDLAVRKFDLALEQEVMDSGLEERTDSDGNTYQFTGITPSDSYRQGYVINNILYLMFSQDYWSYPTTYVNKSSDFLNLSYSSSFNKPVPTDLVVGELSSKPGIWRNFQVSPIFNGRLYASDGKHLFSIDQSSTKPLSWIREPDVPTECTKRDFPTLAVFNNRLFFMPHIWYNAGWEHREKCGRRYFTAVIDTDVTMTLPQVLVADNVVTDKGIATIENGKIKYSTDTHFDAMGLSTTESVILRYTVEDNEGATFMKSAEVVIAKDSNGVIELTANSKFSIEDGALLLEPIPHLKWQEHRLLGDKFLINDRPAVNIRPSDSLIFQSYSPDNVNYSFE